MRKIEKNGIISFLLCFGQSIFWAVMVTGYWPVWYADATQIIDGTGYAIWCISCAAAIVTALLCFLVFHKKKYNEKHPWYVLYIFLGSLCIYFLGTVQKKEWILVLGCISAAFILSTWLLNHSLVNMQKEKSFMIIHILSLSCGAAALFCCVLLTRYGSHFHLNDRQIRFILLILSAFCIFLSLPAVWLGKKMKASEEKNSSQNRGKKESKPSEQRGIFCSFSLLLAGIAVLWGSGAIFAFKLGMNKAQLLWILPLAFFLSACIQPVFSYLAKKRQAAVYLCLFLCFISSLLPITAAFLQKPKENALLGEAETVIAAYAGEQNWSKSKQTRVIRALERPILLPERQDMVTGKLISLYHEKVLNVDEMVDLNMALVHVLDRNDLYEPYERALQKTYIFLYCAFLLGGLGLGGLPWIFPLKQQNFSLPFKIGGLGAAASGLAICAGLSYFTRNANWGFITAPVFLLLSLVVLCIAKRQKESRTTAET